jgi:hypothetical protein
MSSPLLSTKLYIPPLRTELVSRPRLIERLNAGLGRKLTLISAPAGSGKTTLLSAWINQSPIPNRSTERSRQSLQSPRFAWLSLDEGDDDPTRFMLYLVAALQKVEAKYRPGSARGAAIARTGKTQRTPPHAGAPHDAHQPHRRLVHRPAPGAGRLSPRHIPGYSRRPGLFARARARQPAPGHRHPRRPTPAHPAPASARPIDRTAPKRPAL